MCATGHALDKPFLDIATSSSSRAARRACSRSPSTPTTPTTGRFYVYYANNDGDIRVDQFKRKKADPRREPRLAPQGDRDPAPPGQQPQRRPAPVRPRRHPLRSRTGDGGPQAGPRERRPADRQPARQAPADRPEGRRAATRSPTTTRSPTARASDEIYALGLRNPYRFSFDSGNGALTIGDVGGSAWEEVDYVASTAQPGLNFGWNDFEGLDETAFGTGAQRRPHRSTRSTTTATPTSNCARHRRLRRPRPGPADARRAVRLRRLLRGRAAHPAGAIGRARRRRVNLQPSSVSGFGEGFGGQIYVGLAQRRRRPRWRSRVREPPAPRRGALAALGAGAALRSLLGTGPPAPGPPTWATAAAASPRRSSPTTSRPRSTRRRRPDVTPVRLRRRAGRDGARGRRLQRRQDEFMDISGRVSTAGEGGLLSIAFDPDYQSNGLLYAYYTHRRQPRDRDRRVRGDQRHLRRRVVRGREVLDDPAPRRREPPGRDDRVRPRRPPLRGHRRRRRRRRPRRERPGPRRADRQDPADRPPRGRRRRLRGARRTTRSSAARDATRSSPSGCATRSASPSTR